MKTKIIFILFISLVTIIYLFLEHTEVGCVMQKGRWASSGSYCIKKNCYETKSCGMLATPSVNCSQIKVGDDISRVYLLLGEPMRIEGEEYIWPTGKLSDTTIKVMIINHQVQSIGCRTKR